MPLNSELLSRYFLRKGKEFKEFWKAYQSENKKILYVLGLGFDPRTLRCFEIIFNNKNNSTIDCMVIKYDDPDSDLISSLVNSNTSALKKLIAENDWKTKTVKTKSSPEYTIAVDLIKQLKESEFSNYSDIIIDISAIPTSIYFPLIKTVLDWIDSNKIKSLKNTTNLHIVVAENAEFDGKINAITMNDKVKYMYKFGRSLESEARKNLPKVWFPLLGERQISQIKQINQISPEEVCPIFPSPSMDPYRMKKLLLLYREFLLDTLSLDKINFIYSNEQNPFETFRRIYKTAKRYDELFKKLGGCNIVISPLSSKLLCLGSFLASHILLEEGLHIGVAHVENHTYSVASPINFDEVKKKSVPFTIWLTGEVYEN